MVLRTQDININLHFIPIFILLKPWVHINNPNSNPIPPPILDFFLFKFIILFSSSRKPGLRVFSFQCFKNVPLSSILPCFGKKVCRYLYCCRIAFSFSCFKLLFLWFSTVFTVLDLSFVFLVLISLEFADRRSVSQWFSPN